MLTTEVKKMDMRFLNEREELVLRTIIDEYIPSKIGRLSEYKILSISKFAVEKEAFTICSI